MERFSARKAALCAWSGFAKWVTDSRMLIVLCICVFIYSFVSVPIQSNADMMGETANIFEPYLATLNSGMVLLVSPLGFLALISDFPKIDGSTVSCLYRVGRKNWLYGQVLQLFLMVGFYILAIFAASVLGALSFGHAGTQWSVVATGFASMFPEQGQNFGCQLLPPNLYNQLPLMTALAESTLLVAAYLLSIGMILLAFTIARIKPAGIIVCGLLIALGSALCSINAGQMWLLPMAHSVTWLHYTEFLREPVVPMYASALYFAAILLGAFAVSRALVGRFDYDAIASEA